MASTGIRIQERREELKLTRQQLAERLETKPKTTRLKVWRVETGKVLLPADLLPVWAAALETTSAALLEERLA